MKTGGKKGKTEEEQEDQFKAVTAAYDVLSDEEARNAYDQERALSMAQRLGDDGGYA